MAFTHLHLHTEYSLLDGACRINDLVEAVKSRGQTSVAITDHGVMYGVIDFYKAAKEAGIKPVIGCECYVVARTRFDKVHGLDNERYHLILLCKNEIGYKNLIEIVSKSWTEGFYTKPRIDRDLLQKHHEGLIALSACLAGEVPRALSRGDFDGAKSVALWYDEVFGRGNYYIEIQNHALREELLILPDLVRLSEETGIPLVATNDTHYIEKEDSEVQQALICIQTNHVIGEETGLEFSTNEFYLKSEEEMRALFSSVPEAIENTQRIADMCNLEFEFGKTKLPHFDVPNNMDHFEYFKRQCFFGLCQLKGDDPPKEYVDRLNYELSIINQMGYVDYYLIVHDFIRYAKSKKIPVGPGRGSGAASLAAYCIGITGIDPIKYNLLFERFLNPERVSMPDFDVDFCYVRRQEVIDYVIQKYGYDHVAQIVTFGTLAARAAIRDAGRVMGLAYPVVDAVAKQIPNELKITIDKALKISSEFQNSYETNDDTKRLIDMARRIEGMPRHASTHAAGVVITRDEVSSYVPLAVNDESVVTQYTMTALESLGLLKMDFLGLRTLTVIDDTIKMIQKSNLDFSETDIDIEDEETYKMLSSGKTDGVFQFESSGMRSVLSRLRPESIEDLIAVISLYRPGPADSIDTYINNRHHPEQTEYKCEELREILSVTYGCIVYQEQVMQICRKIAGYSYGRADLVRRAMSKKKADVMEKERENFVHGLKDEQGNVLCSGAVANGISEKTANELFDEMSNFAKYAFNKAHAAAYAFVSYQTAYLKCHYPCELLAATLTSVLDSASKVSVYIEECSRLSIKILPPSVNESSEGFTACDGAIRFGLLAVKNLGRGLIKTIIEKRRNSPYKSFDDFCRRVHGKEFNKRAAESLIKCGALDNLGLNRHQMMHMLPIITTQLDEDKRRNIAGQIGFFDENSSFAPSQQFVAPNMEEFEFEKLLEYEKEVTGLYLSGHPMEKYKELSRRISADRISDILLSDSDSRYKDDARVLLFGTISDIQRKATKNNSYMCFIKLEDLSGTIECIVFSKLYSEKAILVQPGNLIVVRGRVSLREDREPTVVCESIEPNPKNIVKADEPPQKKRRKGIFIRLGGKGDERLKKLELLKEILPQGYPVYCFFEDSGKYELFGSIELSEPLEKELCHIFGRENVAVRK